MKKIRVNLGKHSYDILICSNELNKLGACLKRLKIGKDAVIVTNPLIKKLFGGKIKKALVSKGFTVRFEITPDSEKAKSEKECVRLLNNISKFDTSCRVFIVAFGGGVVGDLAGFAASIYKRGIPYIQVPTTLLSQVDSAIGGKTAIDLSTGKNLVGAFYQPELVFSDISFLKSLPKKELASGLAEVIKYGIIISPGLFRFIERNYKNLLACDKKSLRRIVRECSLIKAEIVEKDERDNKNIRIILNLGHTIGHAIETGTHYNDTYNHGEAVALGIIAVTYISQKYNLISKKDAIRIERLIGKIGLPVNLNRERNEIKNLKFRTDIVTNILSAVEHDKKFIHGKNRFVLPVRIGEAVVKENIPEALIKESLLQLYRPYSNVSKKR
ncbi:MAG: 3-dehydroquinate synthase [Candidatus Omnitrophica bacterium CG02_land_8_20_14_3_00__42_8]|nr:MAG: 3-dehydroquinate synthase [Candidatus Omnitrophica bacterium CG02_land_8_20_14_3_00__42_8]